MLFTLLGMVMEVKLLQPQNALSPILITLLGMKVFLHPTISSLEEVLMIALQLSRESYTGFPLSTTIEFKLLQSENARYPMLVTLFGMATEFKLLHSEYLQFVVYQLVWIKTVEK